MFSMMTPNTIHKFSWINVCTNEHSMVYILDYDRIDISNGIHVNNTDSSRKYIICHYWYFLKINFKLQPNVCDGCHDMTKKINEF